MCGFPTNEDLHFRFFFNSDISAFWTYTVFSLQVTHILSTCEMYIQPTSALAMLKLVERSVGKFGQSPDTKFLKHPIQGLIQLKTYLITCQTLKNNLIQVYIYVRIWLKIWHSSLIQVGFVMVFVLDIKLKFPPN